MVTQAKEATAKVATATSSKKSLLRTSAPRIRSPQAIVEKYEQVFDGLDKGTLTLEAAGQMIRALKGIMSVPELEMRYMNMMAKFGSKMPPPRSQVLRRLIGDGKQ